MVTSKFGVWRFGDRSARSAGKGVKPGDSPADAPRQRARGYLQRANRLQGRPAIAK